jgi:hypothetical protein
MPKVIMTDSVDSHSDRIDSHRVSLFWSYFWLIIGIFWVLITYSSPVIPDDVGMIGILIILASGFYLFILKKLWKQHNRRYHYD